MKEYEVLIVGGGMAGLSTALVLGRTLVNCCIISREHFGVSKGLEPHNFITNDSKSLAEMLRDAKADVSKYESVDFKDLSIDKVSYDGNLFHVENDSGVRVTGKRIVFATGSSYNFDSAPKGLSDAFGVSIFNCPFCHGYEMKDKKVTVIGEQQAAVPLANLLSRYTNDITILSNGSELSTGVVSNFASSSAPIEQIHSENGQVEYIAMQNGEQIEAEYVYLASMKDYVKASLPSQLGIEMVFNPAVNMSVYPTDPVGRSQLKNAYIIGDLRTGFSTLVGASNEGNVLGMILVGDISQD
ncbi:NAD(P)/FAD-dependent oxidoreductase [Aliiglaciecola litoralis]|uniref:NAD(P)/FAD-dependent oxidoreductase n=1 Tax=Aliiglaciecola litoralis TaxID=582857 RepID=A0ABN1LFC0_9ALTE